MTDYFLVKDFLDKNTCELLFNYFKYESHLRKLFDTNEKNDHQVPTCLGVFSGSPVNDALLLQCLPKMELLTGLKLYPTYSYGRYHHSGDELKVHTDRPSCEISVTIKIGDTGETNWPIYMDGNKIELQTGDAVVYKGKEVPHWREKLQAPESYRMAQLFLHYVNKDGPYSSFKYDKKKFRQIVMEGNY